MMQAIPMNIPEDVRSAIQSAADRGESAENLSQRMADFGVEKIAAIRLLSETTGVGLAKAKEIIHFSPAWKFRRASDEAFHDRLFQNAETAGLLKPVEDEDAAMESAHASVRA